MASRLLRRLGLAIVCAAPGHPALAQLGLAPEASVTIIGRACLDTVGVGRCDDGAPPARGLMVRAPGGLEAITDHQGRFHLAAVPSRSRAQGPGGLPLMRLPHLPLSIDVTPLGPSVRPPSVVWVDLVPGSTASIEFAVHYPEAAVAPPPLSGPATGRVPAIELGEELLRFHVPISLPPGHTATVDGKALQPETEKMVPVPVGEREGEAIVLDRALDGRIRVLRQVVLRVPRPRGGDLFAPRPIQELATIDLPPPSSPVPPGPLRLMVRAEPGTLVGIGAAPPVTIDDSGRAFISTVVPEDGRLRFSVTVEGVPKVEAEVVLVVDRRRTRHRLLAADLRAGSTGSGLFGEGMLFGQGELRLAGGSLFGGIELHDDDITRIMNGGRLLSARRPGIIERSLDPVLHGAIFGDESTTIHRNPAGLGVWGGWEGPAGMVSLGTGRTGLVGAEAGRFDRPVLGPSVDLVSMLGPVELRVHGGAHLGGTGLLESPTLLFARAELAGTGGSVYRLPHRDIAEGSERVWIETKDPRTGLVAGRRLLVRGHDYQLHHASGLLRMAGPVGLGESPFAGRLGAPGLGFESVIVVDYARLAPPGVASDPGHGAIRLSGALHKVEVGVRGALGWSEVFGPEVEPTRSREHRLGGLDLQAEPWPWLSVFASVARSQGDPFGELAAFRRSRDGGFSSLPAASAGVVDGTEGDAVLAPEGHASSLRFRVGDDRAELTGWWGERSEGYADGATPIEGSQRRLGGLGSARLLGASLAVMADQWEGRHPFGQAKEQGSIATGRLERRFGPISLAGEALHRRGATLPISDEPSLDGRATAAGAELIWHAGERADLSVGHLRALSFEGDHPAGRDPTFSSVGFRLRGPLVGEIDLRGGVHSDLEPALTASWRREPGPDGTASYGSVNLGARAPFHGTEASSVSGARQEYSPNVATFAERRVIDGPEGFIEAQALGAELGEGPWRASLTYERGEGLVPLAVSPVVRDGLHGSFALRFSRWSFSTFGETIRAPTSPSLGAGALGLRQWYAGLSTHLQASETLSFGGRLLAGSASGPVGRELLPQGGDSREAILGAAWRPERGGLLRPALLLHYGVRQESLRLGEDQLLEPASRRHLARVGLTLGSLPGPQARLVATGALHQLIQGEAFGLSSRQGVLMARLGWPLGPMEPALEGGVRAVAGAELPLELEPTLRAELLAVLGPARVGLGGVLAGFAGSGIEEPGVMGDSSRIYLVLRGAIQ